MVPSSRTRFVSASLPCPALWYLANVVCCAELTDVLQVLLKPCSSSNALVHGYTRLQRRDKLRKDRQEITAEHRNKMFARRKSCTWLSLRGSVVAGTCALAGVRMADGWYLVGAVTALTGLRTALPRVRPSTTRLPKDVPEVGEYSIHSKELKNIYLLAFHKI